MKIKALKLKRKADDSSILYQRNAGEKILYAVIAILLAVYCITLIYPLIWLLINSLEDPIQYAYNISKYKVFTFPEALQWVNYANTFRLLNYNGTNFLGMFINSIWLTFTISIVSVFMHALTGYVFAKYEFKGKKLIYTLAIFSLVVPIVGNAAAGMRLSLALGTYNNPIGRIVAGLGGFGSNFLIMLAIFESVSWTYAEAVFIDGGNDFTVFYKIMLPQALPAMLTLFIQAVMQHWKEYENLLLYFPDYPTLMTGLYVLKGEMSTYGAPVYYAGLIISTIPVIVLYAFSSSSMMKNLSVGGIKG